MGRLLNNSLLTYFPVQLLPCEENVATTSIVNGSYKLIVKTFDASDILTNKIFASVLLAKEILPSRLKDEVEKFKLAQLYALNKTINTVTFLIQYK